MQAFPNAAIATVNRLLPLLSFPGQSSYFIAPPVQTAGPDLPHNDENRNKSKHILLLLIDVIPAIVAAVVVF